VRYRHVLHKEQILLELSRRIVHLPVKDGTRGEPRHHCGNDDQDTNNNNQLNKGKAGTAVAH
jgi:hypothetical protein